MRWLAAFTAFAVLGGSLALAKPPARGEGVSEQVCPAGSYSVINAPDGSAVTILFDAFSVTGSDVSSTKRASCAAQIPLNLPAGYSLGVYKVDYRGFAHLEPGQKAELSVDYGLGPKNRSRNYHRGLRGDFDGDFSFTENIGAGLMKRVGCGEEAILNFSASLTLQPRSTPGQSMIVLDSNDGASKQGLVFHLDRKKC